ncbi:MAG: hypothetical protein J7L55_00960 [Desulfurococcales archaeon]|nr:hypothetical protein [Desulfurococcales archaeon]
MVCVVMSATERINELLKQLRSLLTSTVPNMDKLISQTEIRVEGGRKYVVKKFTREVGLIKWIPPAIIFRATYPFTLIPRERFRRELRFFSHPWENVRTPNVLESDEESLTIEREYVEGSILNYGEDLEKLAEGLAEIHSKGWALGDVKPTNFIVGENGLYVIDAEQAVDSGKRTYMAWDLMLTSFFAAYTYLVEVSKYEEFVREFFRKYLDFGGPFDAVKNVGGFRFGGLVLLMPLPHVFTLAETIDDLTLK